MEQVCVVSGVVLYARATERRRLAQLVAQTDGYAKVGTDDDESGEGTSLLGTERP